LVEIMRGWDAIGAHDYAENHISLGVGLAGNFNEEQPTEAQLDSLADVIRVAKKKWGEGVYYEGHGANDDTSCPGRLFPWDKLADRLDESPQAKTVKLPGDEVQVSSDGTVSMPGVSAAAGIMFVPLLVALSVSWLISIVAGNTGEG
jgi:hypothetical protein